MNLVASFNRALGTRLYRSRFKFAQSWRSMSDKADGDDQSEKAYVIRKANRVQKVGTICTPDQVDAPRSHPPLPEICIAGRTNSGKSSLINHLLAKPGIARTSSRAGKTDEINLYMVNSSVILADFPGYGFEHKYGVLAKRWETVWGPLCESYMHRSPVVAALFLADIRWPVTRDDYFFVQTMREAGIPALLVLTKDDRINDRVKAKGHNESLAAKKVTRTVSQARDVHIARSFLTDRVRKGLLWPEDLPHVHYSIESGPARRKLRRWIASLALAKNHDEARQVLRAVLADLGGSMEQAEREYTT
ncbi:hypothetical protein GUITHDRAFT_165280 [Guillardia theta CCMP2712]|uniref:EngB-type G domain-containing protein n=1 Tax=Guillardia theta (strain CCMP2712) TaxID=905079 RepID=L1IQP3_GUITC|nr:hypothetical protein GUITHDRAFT_165280 [Guillardia theta CCMP2712]EKX38140.1 hypothetical protein GUITHDRAFT_165280 [Guillardia theta CCMP2712]|eukprot:XP_005825120.1 hypothetical protein GUITHDRAFT_165280 [Guillardia theta CCMP2712]